MGRRIELTASGCVLFEQTAGLLAHADHAMERTRQATRGQAARVRVAYVSGATWIASETPARPHPAPAPRRTPTEPRRVDRPGALPARQPRRPGPRAPAIDASGLEYAILLSDADREQALQRRSSRWCETPRYCRLVRHRIKGWRDLDLNAGPRATDALGRLCCPTLRRPPRARRLPLRPDRSMQSGRRRRTCLGRAVVRRRPCVLSRSQQRMRDRCLTQR